LLVTKKKKIIMKLRKILGLSLCAFILGLGFTACSDDDEKVESSALSGTFKYTKSEAEVEVTDPEVKEAVIEAVNALSKGGTYVFKLDGTYQAKESSESEAVEGTYKLQGDKLILTNEEGNETLAYQQDVIRSSQDVADQVAEELELEAGVITKAVQINVFEKITK